MSLWRWIRDKVRNWKSRPAPKMLTCFGSEAGFTEHDLRMIRGLDPAVVFEDVDGMRVIAATWKDGLTCWYINLGEVGPKDPEPQEVYEVQCRHPVEGPLFLVLVLSAIERQTGRDPYGLRAYLDDSGNIQGSIAYESFCELVVRYMEHFRVLRVCRPYKREYVSPLGDGTGRLGLTSKGPGWIPEALNWDD